jgi:Fur family ferric uptake transcriptional regulator
VVRVKRNTWQRAAVRSALEGRAGFVSAQELHAALRSTGSPIGLATVYRALADLTVDGDADSLQSADGESLYRACSTARHHHHLICRSCGRTVEIEADAIEQWAAAVASAHGFSDPAHVVDVFGTCAACAAGRGGHDGPDVL